MFLKGYKKLNSIFRVLVLQAERVLIILLPFNLLSYVLRTMIVSCHTGIDSIRGRRLNLFSIIKRFFIDISIMSIFTPIIN